MAKIALFRKAVSGATAIEYSLVAGLIALGIIAAAHGIGTELQQPFRAIQAGFETAN